jgi:arabinan endo-1,5-alpha-L-arabinosidase
MRTSLPARLAGLFLFTMVSGSFCRAQVDTGYVHDPCIIKAGDFYYVYHTGRGVPIKRSSDLYHWERLGQVFDTMPAWTNQEIPNARNVWAPDISFFGGKYHLYYAVSSFGRRRSVIGHATNVVLDPSDARYHWNDEGKVIETHDSDNWNAIDANVVLDEQGTPWMTLGSFWSGIKLIKLDAKTGARDGEELYSLAARPRPGAIEAPFMIRHDGWYYLFVSCDTCCRGANSTYNIRVGRSKTITGPFTDLDGKPMLEGNATMVLESYDYVRGPGHNAILIEGDKTWLVHHYYDARDNGRPKLQIRPMTWDANGKPVAGEPLGPPATSGPSTTPAATAPAALAR